MADGWMHLVRYKSSDALSVSSVWTDVSGCFYTEWMSVKIVLFIFHQQHFEVKQVET